MASPSPLPHLSLSPSSCGARVPGYHPSRK
ncbi:hypothetical protein EJ110_NYTH47753 [Nymphaea thermarum]|nr:hypothetical protein EJ110_NYTH47753 [Nymphaea thermarum]